MRTHWLHRHACLYHCEMACISSKSLVAHTCERPLLLHAAPVCFVHRSGAWTTVVLRSQAQRQNRLLRQPLQLMWTQTSRTSPRSLMDAGGRLTSFAGGGGGGVGGCLGHCHWEGRGGNVKLSATGRRAAVSYGSM